jgi:hypothetical protein
VRVPIFRISLQNATVLSVAYLAAAVLIELSHRYFPLRLTERAALVIEWIPARTLDWVGLYHPIRTAVIDGDLSIFAVRLIFGVTSVLAIFLIALGVGVMMWLVRWAILRADRRHGNA